jgi:hypothetical protein
VHQNIQHAWIVEYKMGETIENWLISGNLFERNGVGSGLVNYYTADRGNQIRFRNIIEDDNYYMYTGYGWATRAHSVDGDIFNAHQYAKEFFFYRDNQFENVVLSNNVFYLAKGGLLHIRGLRDIPEPITFRGNTWVQSNGGAILYQDDISRSYFYDHNAQEVIRRLTRDRTAVVPPPSW